MTNWLRRKLLSFLYPNEDCEAITIDIDEGMEWPDPLTFKLQKATGGYVLEMRHYNHKNNERYVAVHVIPEDQELQTAISKIITYESLKR